MRTSDLVRAGIRARVDAKKTSVEQTAKTAKISPLTVHSFMRGNSDIRLVTLEKFCNVLDIRLDEIIQLGELAIQMKEVAGK